MRDLFVCVVALHFILLSLVANASTLDEIVKAHESGVAQLHSIDVTYVIKYANKAAAEKKCRWIREGNKERMIIDQGLQNAQGQTNFRSDAYTDGTRYRLMSGSGWDQSTKKLPDGVKLLCVDAPHPNILAEIPGPDDFFLVFQVGLNDIRRSLGDFAKGKHLEYIGEEKESNHLVHHIRLVHPGMLDPATGKVEHAGTVFDIYLDPSSGFLARRVDKTFNLNGSVVKYRAEVKEFIDVGQGVFFPGTIEHFSTPLKQEKKLFCRQIATIAKINQRLAPDVFEYTFLEGLFVEVRPVPGEQDKWRFTGKDGKTEREFVDTNELGAFKNSLRNAKVENVRSRRWTWIVLGAIPIVVAVLITWWRRRIGRNK